MPKETFNEESKKTVCLCCNGTGIQIRATDGLKVICPCCDGTGIRKAGKRWGEGWF